MVLHYFSTTRIYLRKCRMKSYTSSELSSINYHHLKSKYYKTRYRYYPVTNRKHFSCDSVCLNATKIVKAIVKWWKKENLPHSLSLLCCQCKVSSFLAFKWLSGVNQTVYANEIVFWKLLAGKSSYAWKNSGTFLIKLILK